MYSSPFDALGVTSLSVRRAVLAVSVYSDIVITISFICRYLV
jgi:hypothetical protein